MRGSERRVGEGKRLLRFDEEPLPVESLTLAFVGPVCAQDLRGVMGVEVLGEGLEELGELPGSLVGQLGKLEDQIGPVCNVVGGLGGVWA